MLGRKLILVAMGLMCTNISVAAEAEANRAKHSKLPTPPNRFPVAPPPQLKNNHPVPLSSVERKPPASSSSNSAQLLDEKTEKFYKEVMANINATFKTIKCISTSISIKEKVFEESKKFTSGPMKGIKKFILGKNKDDNVFDDYIGYMLKIEEYYESILQTYSITVFNEISRQTHKRKVVELTQGVKQEPKIVSPFARELQGLVTNAITLAGPIASKIPGFMVNRIPEGPNAFHEYLNALPYNALNNLKKCITSIEFNDDDLKKFQGTFIEDIEKYQSKNKTEAVLGKNK